jgi:alkylated DNA repair protein (DNA oxidative demethylase)
MRRVTNLPLFENETGTRWNEPLGPGATLLHGFALADETALLDAIKTIADDAPFRNMVTPGGFVMSVAMTNCGTLGWTSDRRSYRYTEIDPITERPWPSMPACFTTLATSAAATAGFESFIPDACLINRYAPGTRLTLHQDKNEQDFSQPIVSVSLGVPAIFLFGGLKRSDKTRRVPLVHGDVVVWGGPDRLRYHGVLTLKESHYPKLGNHRINLTFRKAG